MAKTLAELYVPKDEPNTFDVGVLSEDGQEELVTWVGLALSHPNTPRPTARREQRQAANALAQLLVERSSAYFVDRLIKRLEAEHMSSGKWA